MTIRHRTLTASSRRARAVAVLVAGGLVAAACGGGGGDSDGRDAGDDAGGGGEEVSSPPATDVLDNPRWANVVGGSEASDAEPRRGGSVVVALETETNGYLPSTSTAGRPGLNVAFAIFDPLVTRDASGELRPYLAESVEPNDDFTRWTVTLRPGVRFHDGTPLSADAMKRIWDDYLTADGAFSQTTASRFVERMEIEDELTVTYVMTEANPSFPDLLELQLGWPFSPDAAARLGDAFADQPVGTGPFKFVSWQRDGDFVAERNPDYWQEGLPYLDRITFRPIPDETTRAASLASGDVDAVQAGPLSELVAELADIEDVRVVLGLGNRGGGVMFNTTAPPTDDVRVRQALAHAVDQEALIEVAAGEAAELTEARSQFFPADSRFYSEAVAEATPGHDEARARELYDAYVSDPDRSDGKETGEPISLTLDTINIPNFVELAEAYKGFYEEIGFDVTVRPSEQIQRNVAAVTGDFQAMLFTKGRDSSPLGEFLFYFDEPDDVITNFTNFHDETVIDIIDRLRSAATTDEQAALSEEFGLYLADQVPFDWSASELTLIAARDDLRGLRSWTFPDGTLGDGVTPSVMLWGQAWLETDR